MVAARVARDGARRRRAAQIRRIGLGVRPLSYGEKRAGEGQAEFSDAFLYNDRVGIYGIAAGTVQEGGGRSAARIFLEVLYGRAQQLADAIDAVAGEGAPSWKHLRETFAEAFEEASSVIRKATGGEALTSGTIMMVRDGNAVVAHAGTTRAYFIRANRLVRLTRDHVRKESHDPEADDEVTLIAVPKRGGRRPNHQAIGQAESLRLDGIVFKVQGDDRLVLVSSAVGDLLRGEDIYACHQTAASARDVVRTILTQAAGEGDAGDLSAVVINVMEIATDPTGPGIGADGHPRTDPTVPTLDEAANTLVPPLRRDGARPPTATPAVVPIPDVPTRPVAERSRRLGQLPEAPIFAGIDSARLGRLVDAMVMSSVRPGETIYQAGDEGDRLYVVVMGRLLRVRGERVVAEIGPWDVFGTRCLVPGTRHAHTVRADTTTRLKTLTRDNLRVLMAEDAELGRILLENLGRILLARIDNERTG